MATSCCHYSGMHSAGRGPTRKTIGARTGGRAERVVRVVLKATLAELARVGYGALRTEDVATRAGVAKTTIYRRWPTKFELVDAAIRAKARVGEEVADTGNARADLLALALASLDRLKTPIGRAVARLITTEASNPEVERLARRLREDSRTSRARVVERAKERGELPSDVDAMLVVELIFAPIVSRAIRFGELPEPEYVARVVDLVLTGAAHGGGTPRRRAKRAGLRS